MARALGGSQIILSTLSMISNPSLHDNGTFDIIPVERLIVDEASQINIFEFMVSDYSASSRAHLISIFLQHIFIRFQSKLQKVCFFGDPKQRKFQRFLFYPESSKGIEVPPFGQDQVPSIKTIFDLAHESQTKQDFFLNVQCLCIPIYSLLGPDYFGGRPNWIGSSFEFRFRILQSCEFQNA